jgi:hypothetical protein
MWMVFCLLSVLWCIPSPVHAWQDEVGRMDAQPLRALHHPLPRITPDSHMRAQLVRQDPTRSTDQTLQFFERQQGALGQHLIQQQIEISRQPKWLNKRQRCVSPGRCHLSD